MRTTVSVSARGVGRRTQASRCPIEVHTYHSTTTLDVRINESTESRNEERERVWI